MVATLRESKAKLDELVELASRGEDVLITVRGKVKARLTGVPPPKPKLTAAGNDAWVRELRALRKKYAHAWKRTRTERILAEMREDRF